MINGKTHYKWPFSIATLNYQRVPIYVGTWAFFSGRWTNRYPGITVQETWMSTREFWRWQSNIPADWYWLQAQNLGSSSASRGSRPSGSWLSVFWAWPSSGEWIVLKAGWNLGWFPSALQDALSHVRIALHPGGWVRMGDGLKLGER